MKVSVKFVLNLIMVFCLCTITVDAKDQTKKVATIANDVTAPILDITSIKVDKKEAKPGDIVKISLKAIDDLSGIKRITGYYLAPQTNEQIYVSFSYNEGTKEYEAYIEIKEHMPAGLWKIHFLWLIDNVGNEVSIANIHLDLLDAINKDLSGGDFTVINENGDITPPQLDISSIKVDKKEAKPGDIVKISLKAIDDLSGIKRITGYYLAPQTNEQIYVSFSYNEGTKEYESYIEIKEHMPAGLWKIHFLWLIDNVGNEVSIANIHLDLLDAINKDLSGGDFTVINPDSHVKRVSYFRAENGQLYIDGYSYIRGINIPNQSDIIQKLKFVDVESGKQVKTYELPNFYSTAASKDPNHGAGIYNYDWAKFKGYLDVSDLPIGEYYIKIYTNAKGNKYDEIINFHSSIEDFSFQVNNKNYQFVREGNTLRLTVSQQNPHVKRVSYFRAENGQLYIDGYSYIRGVNIPNQLDIIQKLKFVDVESGKQVKTYELPNFYSTAASKDPNHGAGIYNYDWAKFKGYLDVSDLPTGEYYIKIYTNAKGNKYDEIIAFHSSITDFSFKATDKTFSFKRVEVDDVGTLKLIVK